MMPGGAGKGVGAMDEPVATGEGPDRTLFREGMSRLGAAVSLVATDGAAGRHGFTASAVCSVTDQPPTLLVCMNRGVRAHDSFLANGCLSINVLAGGHEDLSGLFADRSVDMDARFASAEWLPSATGTPLLATSVASFDCRIGPVSTVGTHSVLFCPVLSVRLGEGEVGGLVWFGRAYHRLVGR